jgi:hypothetical protein
MKGDLFLGAIVLTQKQGCQKSDKADVEEKRLSEI